MQIVHVSLENEMDLTLAYKKSIKVAELIGLSRSTQTAFATGVSEVCREVIDKAFEGKVVIEIDFKNNKYVLGAAISYSLNGEDLALEEGLQYAKRLIPGFSHKVTDGKGAIDLEMGIPQSAKLTNAKVREIVNHFLKLEPTTPYEELKEKNYQLFLINEQSEIALQHLEYLNQQKNEFLTVASHELKTPLTILRAYTQMAAKSDCNPVTLSHLKKVDTQARKLQQMITQLLDISKIETKTVEYNKEAVSASSYMNNMADLIKQLVPNHELTISIDTSAIIFIDKLRMEQVIMNIVGNAAKYSPAGTLIRFSVTQTAANDVLFEVKDQGIGLSLDDQAKIFAKFYRAEEVTKNYNGLGMGLYISSKIVTDHEGRLWVESDGTNGSTFSLTIPGFTKL
jgi:signal transduction histidine kinase